MDPSDPPRDARMKSLPWATWSLVAVNVWVALAVTGLFPSEATLAPLWLSRELLAAGEWWRILTSMFAHAGLLHLGFNMFALVSMGTLERELGSARFVTIYMAGGVGGAIAHVVSTAGPAVGASGAIFAMLGLLLVLAPRMELAFFGIPVPAVILLTLYLAAVLLVPSLSAAVPIAHWAHFGGMFVGMAAGLGINPRQGARHLGYIALVFVGMLVLVSAVSRIAWRELPDVLADEGLIGVLAETWLVWLALLSIYIVLYAMRLDEEEQAHVR